VIEHIERLKAELSSKPLRNGEVLEERQIGVEEARTGKCVSAAAKLCQARALESTLGIAVIGKRRYGGEEWNRSCHWVKMAHGRAEISDQNWAANTYVLVRVALVIAGAPRQAAAPVGGGVELEATDDQVQRATGIRHKASAFAERQIVDGAEGEYMLAVEIVRAIVHLRIDIRISAIVGKVLRPGVVANELQPTCEALIHFSLQCIVETWTVVGEVRNILRPAEF